MSNLIELPKPATHPSLDQLADNLRKHIDAGEITGCVVLCVGPGGDDALCYAEGGTLKLPDLLYAWEIWKKHALEPA